MCEIESIQPYHYQFNPQSPVPNYEDYIALDSPKKTSPKEDAITQTCRLEYHLRAEAKKSSAKSKMSSNRLSSHLERSVLGSAVKTLHQQYYGLRSPPGFKNKATQTDYREIECQTIPWEPPYTIKPGHDPEVLTLTHLTWDNGLPAGAHEIDLINRMRIRRAWERVLPPMDTPANRRTRIELMSALEADEWAFRESEIQFVNNLRMELAHKLMQSREDEKQRAMQDRFKKLEEELNARKQKETKGIRRKFSRELRKLSMRHRSAKVPHKKRDIIKLHTDRQLSFSLPKARYECPEDTLCAKKAESLYDFKNDLHCRDWLLASKQRKQNRSAPKPIRLCPRVHRRNEAKFVQLCRDLEAIEAESAAVTAPTCSLLKRKPKVPSLPSTPRRSTSSDDEDEGEEDEDVGRSESLLQRLVKGRAIQSEILEGRNRYKELIEELQSAKALEQHAEEDTRRARQSKQQNPAEDLESLNERRACEILESIEGKTISKTLAFLTDELTRLEGEKRAHALALLAERERIKRQIAQASKEQLELNRREELDEMFRQILKINQESVETYLEDIVKEGIEWSSEKQAEEYIINLADKTDEIAKNWELNADALDEEGLVSDMLYNLVLPEVEKETARQRLQERQRGYLCAAHASIYEATLNLEDEKSIDSEADERVQSVERAIGMILDYAEIPDEQNESEVHDILKDVFKNVEKKRVIRLNDP